MAIKSIKIRKIISIGFIILGIIQLINSFYRYDIYAFLGKRLSIFPISLPTNNEGIFDYGLFLSGAVIIAISIYNYNYTPKK